MKILITGNMGYIGPSVVDQLQSSYQNAKLVGLDAGFFAHCLTGASMLPEARLHQQIFRDVRHVTADVLEDVYAVVHLAGISNDPIGNSFAQATDEINCQSSIRLAKLSREMGVKRFVFASSCSVYGSAKGGPRREDDELNPLTAYAKSKIETEKGIADLASDDFVITCLRFATACGMSERLRLDLVLNDFVAGAVVAKRIEILSDGTPWRPLIDINDMARAIDWGVVRSASNGGAFLAVNAGIDEWNFQVKDLAEAVATFIPDVHVSINKNAMPDTRSYQVDFSLFKKLAPNYQPKKNLTDTLRGLVDGLERMKFSQPDFRNSDFMRLKVLNGFRETNRINEKMEWVFGGVS